MASFNFDSKEEVMAQSGRMKGALETMEEETTSVLKTITDFGNTISKGLQSFSPELAKIVPIINSMKETVEDSEKTFGRLAMYLEQMDTIASKDL